MFTESSLEANDGTTSRVATAAEKNIMVSTKTSFGRYDFKDCKARGCVRTRAKRWSQRAFHLALAKFFAGVTAAHR